MVSVDAWMRDEQEKSEVKNPTLPKNRRPPAICGRLGTCSVRLRLCSSPSPVLTGARESTFPQRSPITLASLAFACLGTWQDPPVYAIVARDQQVIHFRCAEPPTANPDKYADELLDAYLVVEVADALYAEYAAQGVEFTRGLGNMPWHRREFVVKDCDGRLLAFGANL